MKISKKIIDPILPILSTVLVVLLEFIKNGPGMSMVKLGVLTLLLTIAAGIYLYAFESSIFNNKYEKFIVLLSYLGSIGLLYVVERPETFSFWMLGGLLISMLFDPKMGLLLHFNLTFLIGIGFAERMESVLQLLLIGIIMNMLSKYLKQKSTVIYAAIIILSTNITLVFIMNNFVMDTRLGYNYMNSFFSILTVIVIGFFLCKLYEKFGLKVFKTGKNEDNLKLDEENLLDDSDNKAEDKESVESEPAELVVQEVTGIDLKATEGLRTNYDLLLDENNELLLQLKEKSASLYEHALRIGDLSYRAARAIQADEVLAKAGGLYHEIGKIREGNYIEQGLKIAEEYRFPEKLISILKQHNIKYEKPTFVEAAIVMLSDNVVSTITYIEKTQNDKYSRSKIIENIFQMRMEKGTFDESHLSIKDFKVLKEFYQKEFANKYENTN